MRVFIFISHFFLISAICLGQSDSSNSLDLSKIDLRDSRALEVSQFIEKTNIDHLQTPDWLKNQGVPEESDYYAIYGGFTLLAGEEAEKIVFICDADVDYIFISKTSNLKPIEYFKSGKKVSQVDGAYFITMINAVPIALLPNEEVTLTMKFLSKEKGLPYAEIKAFEPVEDLFRSRLLLSYIFTAILLTFASYHFALAFYTKDRLYFYYSYYVLSFAGYASLTALSTLFSASVVMPISVAISSAAIALGALFAGEFLKLKSNLSKVMPFYKGLIYHVFLVSGMLVWNIYLESLVLLNLLATATAFVGLFSIVFWIYVGIKIYRCGNLLGRLFLITNVPILIGATYFISVWILITLQWITVSTDFALMSNVVFQVSVIFQLFLFSYFVGYSIKKLQVEKLQIQQTINLQLEQQVAERTASLTKANQSIEDQKAQLAELNHIKDNLFSIVSHDLRNPLNSIKGLLSLMKKKSLEGEELEFITTKLEGSLDSTLNLLDNLLYWAKSQMEGIQANPQLIQPKVLIENNLRLALTLFNEKEINVSTELNNKYALADEDMIDLVVRNLLSNAIKFTPAQGHISLKMYTKDSFLCFSIEDNGIGMSSELISGLFSTGQRHTSYGTNNEKGYGLGLKLCKDFIEINRGNLHVVSEENQGSIFTVSLPTK